MLGLLRAEAEGKRFLYRTGASFVRARAGISAFPLLRRSELLGENAPRPARGLVVVGSHVLRTTEQLQRLLLNSNIAGIEVAVPALLHDADNRDLEIARVRRRADDAITTGRTPVVYTSRQVERPEGMEELVVARAVSDALVAIVRGVEERPDFVVGKGGITSSDVGTLGLGAERATVLGQVRPGVARLASRAGESIPGHAVHRLPRQRRRCGVARRHCSRSSSAFSAERRIGPRNRHLTALHDPRWICCYGDG